MKAVILDFNRTVYNPEKNELVEGAKSLVSEIKEQGLKLALISIAKPGRMETIRQLDIFSFFDLIEIMNKKTERMFAKTAEKLCAEANEIIVIGDRARKEIAIGRKLGMKTIWLRRGKFAVEAPKKQEDLPDFVIARLEDAIPIIKTTKYINQDKTR